MAPVARENNAAARITGNPQPAFTPLGWGHAAWFSGVSGMDSPVPSTTMTLRPCHDHWQAVSILFDIRRLACWSSTGRSFARALQ